MRSFSLTWLVLFTLLIALLPSQSPTYAATPDGFADAAFRQVWTRTDAPVADGNAGRSWTWGEFPGERRYERYDQSPGGSRLVQYLDKARMEITDPAGDRTSPWFVTGGLLVVEMIVGRLQVGATTFELRWPAGIPVAGDPLNNPTAPTYAMLAPLAAIDGANRVDARLGQPVSATFGPQGVGDDPTLIRPETTITYYEPVTRRNVPRVFRDFMQQQGPVLENGRRTTGQVVDPLFAFGYPITEPYWAQVHVAGTPVRVLFQAFERRLLTYNPANPDPWKVEMGNVGQHYFSWRQGHELHYARPVPATALTLREATITLPTYDLTPALRPSTPADPIFPYDRLDWAQVGAPAPRTYRAVIVENRFLTLTFLPELGGRLLQVVDRTSGRPIFYQNPVVKPSPFGQRGWWLGVGGLEWAAPTEEHGYLENVPWELSTSQVGTALQVRVTTVERQSGMQVTGIVTLHADESRLGVRMEVRNPSGTALPLQMWTNATLSPAGDNRIGPALRFVVPTDSVVVHATQDRDLPPAHSQLAWPVYNGRDLRNPANWTGYLGAFTRVPVPFLAAYDVNADSGAAVVQGAGAVGGKFFGFSPTVDRSLYTDGDSEYVELWTGAQPTFWDYPPLEAGATRAIENTWLPLWGLGMPVAATTDGALGLARRSDGGLTVTLATPRLMSGVPIVISMDGREVFRTPPVDLRPDLPLAIELPSWAGGLVRVEAGGLVWEGGA